MNTTYTALAGIAGICLLIGFTAALSFRQEISLAFKKKTRKPNNQPLHLNSLELFPEDDNAFGKKRHQLTIPGNADLQKEEPKIAGAV